MTTITLYEDNGGGLAITDPDGGLWIGLDLTDSTFRADIDGIINGDTINWTVERVTDERDINDIINVAGTSAVARYTDGVITILGAPGHSARRYLAGVGAPS